MKTSQLVPLSVILSCTALLAPTALGQSSNESKSSSSNREQSQRQSDSEQQSSQNQSESNEWDWGDNRTRSSRSSNSQDWSRNDQSENQRQSQRGSQSQSDSQSQRSNQSQPDSQAGQQSRYMLRPSGWITIATDYNNDGRFEGRETIYYYDLVEARKRSQGREQESMSGQQDRRQGTSDRPSNSQASSQDQRLMQLSGEIVSLRQGRIGDGDTRYTIARIESDSGRTRSVNLGPRDEVQQIDLQEGDKISVLCYAGRIDGRTALIAEKFRANGETIDVRESTQRSLQRDFSRSQSTWGDRQSRSSESSGSKSSDSRSSSLRSTSY